MDALSTREPTSPSNTNALDARTAQGRVLAFVFFIQGASYRETATRLGVSRSTVDRYLKGIIGPVHLSPFKPHNDELRHAYLIKELWQAVWPRLVSHSIAGLQESSHFELPLYVGKNKGKEFESAVQMLRCYQSYVEGFTYWEIGEDIGMSAAAVGNRMARLTGKLMYEPRRGEVPTLDSVTPLLRKLVREGLIPAATGEPYDIWTAWPPLSPWLLRMYRLGKPEPLDLRTTAVAPVLKAMPLKANRGYWGVNKGKRQSALEKRDRIVELRRQRLTYRQIGQSVGISAVAVGKHIQAAGQSEAEALYQALNPAAPPLNTAEREAQAGAMRRVWANYEQIAARLNYSSAGRAYRAVARDFERRRKLGLEW